MLQPHPLYTFFAEQLSLTSPKSWRGVGFRSVVPRYANARDMISGAGAFRGGGRWNTPGRVGVNLVVYPKSLRASSILAIEGQEELRW
jgi:RES domain-containing protein